MRKIASLMLAILLVVGLANPAYAKGAGKDKGKDHGKDPFVPSISYKGKPSFVKIDKEDKKDPPGKDKEDKKDPPGKDKDDKGDKDNKDEEKKKIIIGVVLKDTSVKDPQKQPENVPTKPGETVGKETTPGKQETQGHVPGEEMPGDEYNYEHEEYEEVVSYVYEECLVVTPVAEVDTSEDIPPKEAETLRYVYTEISEGRMKLPYDEVEDYNGEDMVVMELMDISWLCKESVQKERNVYHDHDHHKELEPVENVFEATFDLGVAPDAHVIVMTYNDGKWNPIKRVVNNGDGTVSCTFEHFCPVAISIGQGTGIQEAENSNAFLVWVVAFLAALGMMTVIIFKNKKKKQQAK